MDLKDINPIKTVLDSEQGKNLTVPVTKRVGIFFDDIFDLVFGGWSHEIAEKKRIKHQKNIEDFKKQLYEDASKIPEDNLIPPKESIVGPALEASKYYFDEEEIRDMFEKLITNSMDNRKTTKVHPSFTEIIKQLSPLDAQNLKLFQEEQVLPIVEYRIQREGGYNVVKTNVFLENPEVQEIDIQAMSVASLERVGLVSIAYGVYLANNVLYEKYENNPFYLSLVNAIKSLSIEPTAKVKSAKVEKGEIKLTPLGQSFIDVCLAPLSQQ